jgi:hypothetical protein
MGHYTAISAVGDKPSLAHQHPAQPHLCRLYWREKNTVIKGKTGKARIVKLNEKGAHYC